MRAAYYVNQKNIGFDKSSFEESDSRYIEVFSEDEAKNALYNLSDSEYHENLHNAIQEVESALENDRPPNVLSHVESMPNCWPIVHFRKERFTDAALAAQMKDIYNVDEYNVSLQDHLKIIRRTIDKRHRNWSSVISTHKHEYPRTHRYDTQLKNFKLNSSRDVMWLPTTWDDQSVKIESYFEEKYRFGCLRDDGKKRRGDEAWELVNKDDIEEHRKNFWLDYIFSDGCDSHAKHPDKLKTFEFRRELKNENIVLRGFFSKHEPTLRCFKKFDVDRYFRDLNYMLDNVARKKIKCKLISSNDEKKVSAIKKVDDRLILKDEEGNDIEFDVKNHPSDWLLFNENGENNIYRKQEFFESNILFIVEGESIEHISLFIPTVMDYFDCFEDELHDMEKVQHHLQKYFNTRLEDLSEYEFIYYVTLKKNRSKEKQKKKSSEEKQKKNRSEEKQQDLWKSGIMDENKNKNYLTRKFEDIKKLGDVELYEASDRTYDDIFKIPEKGEDIEASLDNLKKLKSSYNQKVPNDENNKYKRTKTNMKELKTSLNQFRLRSISYFSKTHEMSFKALDGIEVDASKSEVVREEIKLGDNYGIQELTLDDRYTDEQLSQRSGLVLQSGVAADFYGIITGVGMNLNADELKAVYESFDYVWNKLLSYARKKGKDLTANPNNRISYIYGCLAIFGQIIGRDFKIDVKFEKNYSLDNSNWRSILDDKFNSENIYKGKSLFAYLSRHYEANYGRLSDQKLLITRARNILSNLADLKKKLENSLLTQGTKESSAYESESQTLKYKEFNMKKEKTKFQPPELRTDYVRTSKPTPTQNWIVEEINELRKTIRSFGGEGHNKLDDAMIDDLIQHSERESGLSKYFAAQLKDRVVSETIAKIMQILESQVEKNQKKDNYVYEGEFDMNNEIVKWFQKWSDKVDLDEEAKDEENDSIKRRVKPYTSHLLSGKSILKNAIIREDNKFYLHYIVLIEKVLKLHEYLKEQINESYVSIDIIFESASKNYNETTDGLLEREKLRENIQLIRSKERIEKNKADDAMEDEDRELNDARIQYNLSAPRPDEDVDINVGDLEPVLSQDERDGDNED